jgi:hypothetical protein
VDDQALADRLVNYEDALTAVSFVGMSGLAITLSDPDTRCSLVQALPTVAIATTLYCAVVSALLVVLRRWESDLGSSTTISKKSATYSRRLHVARQVVVWFSAAAVVAALLGASPDPNCAF